MSKCKNCSKETAEHSKGMCITCYKKLVWKPKLVKCKRCGRDKPMHAKGLCVGCYNSVFHIESVREHNARKYHNIDPVRYKAITSACAICEFDKIVELHHLDNNHDNNAETNLIGICPNHHKMLHHRKFRKDLFAVLKEKGFQVPNVYEDDEVFRTQAADRINP